MISRGLAPWLVAASLLPGCTTTHTEADLREAGDPTGGGASRAGGGQERRARGGRRDQRGSSWTRQKSQLDRDINR